MANKVKKLRPKIDHGDGYLYWIGNGDLWRALKAEKRSERVEKPKRAYRKLGLTIEPGWVYFVDKDGDVSRSRPTHERVVARRNNRKRR